MEKMQSLKMKWVKEAQTFLGNTKFKWMRWAIFSYCLLACCCFPRAIYSSLLISRFWWFLMLIFIFLFCRWIFFLIWFSIYAFCSDGEDYWRTEKRYEYRNDSRTKIIDKYWILLNFELGILYWRNDKNILTKVEQKLSINI